MSLYLGEFCDIGTSRGADLYPGEAFIKVTKISKETIQCVLESTQRSYHKLTRFSFQQIQGYWIEISGGHCIELAVTPSH